MEAIELEDPAPAGIMMMAEGGFLAPMEANTELGVRTGIAVMNLQEEEARARKVIAGEIRPVPFSGPLDRSAVFGPAGTRNPGRSRNPREPGHQSSVKPGSLKRGQSLKRATH